jgi:hypothetical protein
MGYAGTRTVDFAQDELDQPPQGFEFGHTAGVGRRGRWILQADGTSKVVAPAGPDSTRSRFPVAVLSDLTAADVDLSVRFKPVSGRGDQAAGLVWRYQAAGGCDRSGPAAVRTVTIYVSTDRVFSEPVLREYHRRSGARQSEAACT